MKQYTLIAKGVCSEFNISEISKHYGIEKKVKWEEPLIIIDNIKSMYIYHFGVIVFINFDDKDIEGNIEEIKNIPNSIKSINKDIKYNEIERYNLIEDKSIKEKEVEFTSYRSDVIDKYILNMTALVLAKSVALEIIENNVDKVFDQIETQIIKLKKGRLRINDKKVTSMIGKILSFKHTTISYIMMLDKPSLAWKDPEAEEHFNEMYDLFELEDRYNNLNAKLETLLDTVKIIADLQHSKTANKMELIVILLILIEVIHAFEGQIIGLIQKILG